MLLLDALGLNQVILIPDDYARFALPPALTPTISSSSIAAAHACARCCYCFFYFYINRGNS
jgi:hypothetical protein